MNACRKVCGPTGFADPGAAGHSPDDPGGAVPVQPLPVRAAEDRPVHALADSQVDCPRGAGCERDGDDLAAFPYDGQRPVTALETQPLNIRIDGFGNAQAIQCQHAYQRMISCAGQPGGDKHRADLVAV